MGPGDDVKHASERCADKASEMRGMKSRSAGGSPARTKVSRWHSRGYLPHFDEPGLVQMVTYRLVDSLPGTALRSIPNALSTTARRERIETLLDSGYGDWRLNDQRIAGMVEQDWLHFDGSRYRLLAWVVMPNHVHVLIETAYEYSLSSILHSWKSYTAKKANLILGRTGAFWQPEYFDRSIRDDRHLAATIEYVENNPVKAGLAEEPENWPFSSAARSKRGILAGGPPTLHE
jgi:putative DNA methylase